MSVSLSRTNCRLIILGSILVSTIGVMASWLIFTQRVATLFETQQASDNLAQVLAEQTSRTLQPIDLTLRELTGQLSASVGPGVNYGPEQNRQPLHDLLVEKLKGLPQVDALVLVSADGWMLSSSRIFPAPPMDLSDRDYYRHFSKNDDHGLFVSVPLKSRMSGLWSVYFSRRLAGPHGEFAGVAGAVVSLAYLEDFYRAAMPANWSVTVLRHDGTILVRYPSVEQQIGVKLPADADWYRRVGEGGGSYRSPGYLDGTVSLITVHPMRDFPMVIDTGQHETAALLNWHQQTRWVLAGAVSAVAFTILLLGFFGRQFGQLERSKVVLNRQNAELESSRLRFDAALENMSQGLTFFDGEQKLVVSNRRYREIYRLLQDQTCIGTSLLDILHCRQAAGSFVDMTPDAYLARRDQLSRAGQPFDVTDELSDGRVIVMQYQPLPNGGWVTTHEDITDRRRAEASLAFMARHDALTALPNRTLFHERLVAAIAEVRHGMHCALLCIDLDRFKIINDTLGHPVGDGLLRAVAIRLSAAVRDVDTVARLGGDEFAVVQVGIKSSEHAAGLANRIITALHEPYDIDGNRIVIGSSIGISLAPKDGMSSESLMKNADIALYVAKLAGRGTYRVFEPELDAQVHERRLIELDLREALPAAQFELHYQPILDLRSGQVTAFEALLRWNHPIRGLISPADFIPIAEETGLIIPIGAWALHTACKTAVTWPNDVDVAVNLSPAQFNGKQLVDVVRSALSASGLAPHRLELEITESVLLASSDESLSQLRQLRALGIRIALDDFGTGYSSLSYLRSFPFDTIKIDQSFIRDIDMNRDSTVIVGAIIGLARSLGMTAVAEGVETAQQLAVLGEQGCERVQGYLFSRPRPAVDVAGIIRTLSIPRQSDPQPESLPDNGRNAWFGGVWATTPTGTVNLLATESGNATTVWTTAIDREMPQPSPRW